MKRFSLILVALLILALITGCGGVKPGQVGQPTTIGDTPVVDNSSAGAETASDEPGAQIIAKSGNIISSKDKEAVLNEVSKELDALLQNINDLEDVSDEDLKL